MLNENDLGAWLDEESSTAPSSFEEQDTGLSDQDLDAFLTEGGEDLSLLERGADWLVNNTSNKTRETVNDIVSAPVRAIKQIGQDTIDIRNKYTNQVNEAMNTEPTPSGNPLVDAGKRALTGLGIVGGTAGQITAPFEAGFRQIYRPIVEATMGDLSKEARNSMVDEGAANITAGASMTPIKLTNKVPAALSRPASAIEEAAPAIRKEPVFDSGFDKEIDDFLEAEAVKSRTEALGQVALGARNPFKMADEQIAEATANLPALRSAKEIQDEINIVAQDTSIGGARERLAELQAEKFAVENPAEAAKQALATRKAEGPAKLTDEQFETNIGWTTRNALDAGATTTQVRRELEENLAVTIKDPVYRQELVDRAIPEVYQVADDFADDVSAGYTHLTPETNRGIIDVVTPDDGSILDGVVTIPPSAAADKATKPITLQGRIRSRMADSTNMMSLVSRQWAKRNGINIGSKSLREQDDWTVSRNLTQRGNALWKSIVGNPNGSDVGILWPSKGSELVPDTSIDNFNASIVKARQMGMQADEMREVLNVYNVYDDYANIDRILQKADVQITALKQAPNKTKAIKEEIRYWKDIKKEYTNKESFLTREEVQAGIEKYQDNPAAQYFLGNKNAINKKMVALMAESGRISKVEADRLITAHPNYTPAWRDVDDFTYADIEVHNSGGSTQPFRFRKVSNKQDVKDPLASTAQNIVSSIRKIEQTQYRTAALNKWLENATPEDFAVGFREDLTMVKHAIDEIKSGGKQRWSAEDITPTATGKVQKVGNITFDIEGGQIQLTITDRDLFQEFSQARQWEGTNKLYEMMSKLTRFQRNFIVMNPEFPIRNFQRETMDAMVGAKTSLGQKLKYPFSNVKNLFAKETNPDLYQHIVDNIGYGSRRGDNLTTKQVFKDVEVPTFAGGSVTKNVYESNLAEITKEVAEGTYKEGLVSKAVKPLESFANRFDMAPRITLYEWMMRDGAAKGLTSNEAHEAAIFAARNLGVNFTQKGSLAQFDKVIGLIPFARSFVNGTDRMVQLGRYEPARMARNVFMLYGAYKGVTTYNSQFKDTDGVPFIDKVDPNLKKDTIPIYGPWSKGVNDFFPLRMGWVYGRALPAMDTSMAYMMQEIGAKVQSGIESDIQGILQGDEETKKLDAKQVVAAWGDYVGGVVSPSGMLPPIMSQAYALGTNKDFRGNPIVPEQLKESPAWAQYNDQTPQTLVDFSYYLSHHGIDVSPAKSQYLLNSLFSSAATYTLQAGDLIYGAASGREAPEIENRAIPGMSLVTGRTTDVPREGIETQFSNLGDYLTSVNKEYKAIEKRTEVDANAYNELQQFEIEHAVELAYYSEWKDVSADIGPNRSMGTAISKARKDELQGYQTPENELLGDPEKRKAMNRLRTNSIDTMKAFMKKIETDPNAENLWYERMSRTSAGKVAEGLFDTVTPDKEEDKTITVFEPMSNVTEVAVKKGSSPFDLMDAEANTDTGYSSSPFDLMKTPAPKAEGMFKVRSGPTKETKATKQDDEPLKQGMFRRILPNIAKGVDNMSKDKIFDKVIAKEGGSKFTNDPIDRGGATKFGVTLATLQRINPKATETDVKNLDLKQAKAIYDKLFWTGANVDKVNSDLQDVVFDGNINHGVGGMTRVIQRAINDLGGSVPVDGKMGNATLNALNALPADEARAAIIKRRESLYRHIVKKDPTQNRFKRGWLNRLTSFRTPIRDSDNA